jgi:hypothetical protein
MDGNKQVSADHPPQTDMLQSDRKAQDDQPNAPLDSPPTAERVEMKQVALPTVNPALPPVGGSPPRSPKLTLHRRNRSSGGKPVPKPRKLKEFGRETLEHVASKPWDRDFMTIGIHIM